MAVTVDVRRHWDPRVEQTDEITPRAGCSILVAWQVDPPTTDAEVPPEMAACLAEALTSWGSVWFRWCGAPPAHEAGGRMIPAPQRDMLRRMTDRLAVSWPIDVMVTRSPTLAVQCFQFEWDSQGQVVLVVDPLCDDTCAVLAALRTRRNWQEFELSPPVIALLAPIVDGQGAILCTQSEDKLQGLVRSLEGHLRNVGVRYRFHQS
jgi:hypothetical protein